MSSIRRGQRSACSVRPSQPWLARGKLTVLDRRTETSATWANPEGTYTTTVSGGPVRKLEDGWWVVVNATLRRQADGGAEAEIHPGDLRLAGPAAAWA